ncbi:MAG: hypothetical protein RLZZ238_381 [Planctomycetota bacterium]|jgi:hypothetical protein
MLSTHIAVFLLASRLGATQSDGVLDAVTVPDHASKVADRRVFVEECVAEKHRLLRQYARPSGRSQLVRTLQRIDAVDRLIGWWEHCPEDLRSEPPVVPGIEVLRSEAHRLRKRMAELEWSISF